MQHCTQYFYFSFHETGPRRVAVYRGLLGYTWVSLVMSISCNMRIILHPIHVVVSVYVPIQVETHHISQHDIICWDLL